MGRLTQPRRTQGPLQAAPWPAMPGHNHSIAMARAVHAQQAAARQSTQHMREAATSGSRQLPSLAVKTRVLTVLSRRHGCRACCCAGPVGQVPVPGDLKRVTLHAHWVNIAPVSQMSLTLLLPLCPILQACTRLVPCWYGRLEHQGHKDTEYQLAGLHWRSAASGGQWLMPMCAPDHCVCVCFTCRRRGVCWLRTC